ncbi:unnamed protein product [Calypogeia fissa]
MDCKPEDEAEEDFVSDENAHHDVAQGEDDRVGFGVGEVVGAGEGEADGVECDGEKVFLRRVDSFLVLCSQAHKLHKLWGSSTVHLPGLRQVLSKPTNFLKFGV